MSEIKISKIEFHGCLEFFRPFEIMLIEMLDHIVQIEKELNRNIRNGLEYEISIRNSIRSHSTESETKINIH